MTLSDFQIIIVPPICSPSLNQGEGLIPFTNVKLLA
jgi:hypothetical protein